MFRVNLFKFIFVAMLLQLFFIETTLAQCDSSFDKINLNCIESQNKSFAKDDIEIKKSKNSAPSIVDQVYFFELANGIKGKFKIVAASYIDDECSVLLDITSYARFGPISPHGSFTITKEFGSWGSERISLLGEPGGADLILTIDEKKCVLKPENASLFKYKKMNSEEEITGSSILFYSSLFLIFLAALLISRAFFADEDKFKAQSALDEIDQSETKNKTKEDFLIKFSKPFYKRYFAPIVMSMKNKKGIKDKYRRRLASAGLTKTITPEEFFSLKLFLIIAFPIIYIILKEVLETDWPLGLLPAVAGFGFYYPELWLNGKIQIRKRELIRSMPFIVDMLALSVEAGLDFMAAMVKVIEKAPPSPLSEEFEILIKDTRIGASRAEGLRQLSWRTDTLEIASFCATLIAADSVGASIAPILKTLSAEMRQKRSAIAEKEGATAATKILFPMMFLILPAVGVVILAPFVLQFLGVN